MPRAQLGNTRWSLGPRCRARVGAWSDAIDSTGVKVGHLEDLLPLSLDFFDLSIIKSLPGQDELYQ